MIKSFNHFTFVSGERYDFVLFANNTPGDYWIRVQSYGDCVSGNNDGHGAAILHYNGFEGNEDHTPNTDVEDFDKKGIVSLNNLLKYDIISLKIFFRTDHQFLSIVLVASNKTIIDYMVI